MLRDNISCDDPREPRNEVFRTSLYEHIQRIANVRRTHLVEFFCYNLCMQTSCL